MSLQFIIQMTRLEQFLFKDSLIQLIQFTLSLQLAIHWFSWSIQNEFAVNDSLIQLLSIDKKIRSASDMLFWGVAHCFIVQWCFMLEKQGQSGVRKDCRWCWAVLSWSLIHFLPLKPALWCVWKQLSLRPQECKEWTAFFPPSFLLNSLRGPLFLLKNRFSTQIIYSLT